MVECSELVTATTPTAGNIVALLETDLGLWVGGTRPDEEGIYHGWMAKLDEKQAVVWELNLSEFGSVLALVESDGGVLALESRASETVGVHLVDASGELVETTTIPEIDGATPLAKSMTRHGDRLVIGGSLLGDAWFGTLGDDDQLTTRLLEDQLGFFDSVDHLIDTRDGLTAVVHVGTTPGVMGGDVLMLETKDTLLIGYDDQLNEIERTTLSSDEEYVSTITTAASPTSDDSLVVAGYRESTLDSSGRTAWLTGLRGGALQWSSKWSGPPVTGAPWPHSSLHALGVVRDHVIVGGHLRTSEGIRRQHMLISPGSEEVIEERVEEFGGEFDGYEAGVTGLGGSAWFAGSSVSKDEVTQWVCQLRLASSQGS